MREALQEPSEMLPEKGFKFVTTSDSSGRYLFRSVAPGLYSVTAEGKGFAKVTSARFKVDVNENATTNLKLKVGAASQTVEVGAQSQTIQTEDAETGQVVNRRYINDLPLIERNIVALTSLAPGVTEMDDQCGTGNRVTPNRIEAGHAKAPQQPPGGYSHCACSRLYSPFRSLTPWSGNFECNR